MEVSWTMASNSSSTMVALIPKKIILTVLVMAVVIPIGFVSTPCFVSISLCLGKVSLIGRARSSQHFKLIILIYCVIYLSLQKNARVVTIDGYEDVPENDENSLKKAVANQPVSVAIEAGGRAFQLYDSVVDCISPLISTDIISVELNNYIWVVLPTNA